MEISLIAIIGAGTMGTKVAHRCIVSGLQTMIYDKYPETLEQAEKQIKIWLDERIKQNYLTADQTQAAISRLHSCPTLSECVREADLVIETVPENIDLKRLVLAEINRILHEKAFVCTNSSSLPC